jgi:hypothetical protein
VFAVASILPPQQRWSLDSIDWHAVRSGAVDGSDPLFYLIAAASFVEITTHLYTQNLIEQFSENAEISTWLAQHWLPEELQHGQALRRYVQIAWPDFEWDRVYRSFLDEFTAYCTVEGLEPTHSREMAARCVVEMGTAGYYTMLSRLSPEPVLATLARCIAEDEVRHYKHFYRYFRGFRATENTSRIAVSQALWNRLGKIDGEESRVAVKHLYLSQHPDDRFDDSIYRGIRRSSRDLIRPHFPYKMCVRMLLKPLGLGPRARHIVIPLVETLARRIVP